jgi:replicative DNA helicase
VANKELQTLNAVLKNNDINVLYNQPGHEELFSAYKDVVSFIKTYHTKYGATPSVDVVVEKYSKFAEVEVNGQTEAYLDDLKDEFVKSRIANIITNADMALGEHASNAVLAKLQESLSGLNRFAAGAVDLNIMDFDNALEHYDEVRERAQAMGGVPGISTGIPWFDSAYTSGLAPGDLVIVLGWTGRAKSLFTTLLSCRAHDCGFTPMIVSLEMSGQKVRDRVYTIKGSGLFSNSGLGLGDIHTDNFREFAKREEHKPEFIVVTNEGAAELTPNVVEAKIDQHKPKMVVIDYAQLASDNANSDNMTQRMLNMSKEYKRLAVKKQVIIILISSATPDGSTGTKEPPTINQVAWSRQLAYDADLAITVHKMDESNLIAIICTKNRNGPLFAGYLEWDIDNGIIDDNPPI